MKTVFLALLALVATAIPAKADSEPPAAPFLRIETGQHTAVINRLSADAGGRLVATASDDKTLRLWTAADGQLVATLRVPIGPADEGALYAVALSPDGRSVMATGNTGSWNGLPVLYLFDVEQQRLKGRLPLPAVAYHLAYSPDGRFVAAGFDGRVGLKVYDATNGKLVAEDKDYGDRVPWLAFDRTGRLATASFDGRIRLYDAQFRRIANQPAPAGKRPFSVAFSPDGALLAVGYADQPKVSLLAADSLKPAPSPSTADLKTGNLAVVAWIGDGGTAPQLAAAGTATGRDGRMLLRLWRNRGAGEARDIALARDSVTDLEPVAGGLMVAAADPAWGRLDGDGSTLYWRPGAVGDFRDIAEGRFGISGDGLTVEFGMNKGGRKPFRFDFATRSLKPDPAPDPALAKPAGKSKGLTLVAADWKNRTDPRLGSRTLSLSPEERARSAAVTPEGDRFILGTDYFLRLYDARGAELRRVEVPAAAWGVMIAGNGRLAVAALGDGTLRWYSLVSGEELSERAALFPHPDGRRWVAWTPQAFFDHADLGGKELVGFHLNQGKSKLAQWVDFSQVYRLYFAPDLVVKTVAGDDPAAIRSRLAEIGDVRVRLEARPLPKVDLISYCVTGQPGGDACRTIDLNQTSRGGGAPAAAGAAGESAASFRSVLPPGTPAIKLVFKVADQGGGVGPVDVFLNERNVGRAPTRGFARVTTGAPPAAQAAPGTETEERSIQLDPGVNRIVVRAYEGSGAVFMRSAVIELSEPAAPVPAATAQTPAAVPAAAPQPPVLHVLSVGIDRYAGKGISQLQFGVADARAFAQAVRQHAGGLYRDVRVVELYDEQATLAGVTAALGQLGKTAGNADTVLIYLAGHGYADDKVPYHFITQNVSAASLEAFDTESLTQETLVQLLTEIPARNTFLFLDTCHAGAVPNLSAVNQSAGNIGHEIGRYILAASASDQEARDSYDGNNGLLAYALVHGLSGEAPVVAGAVDSINLGQFARDKVNALNDELNRRQGDAHSQRALFKVYAEDFRAFPLAAVR